MREREREREREKMKENEYAKDVFSSVIIPAVKENEGSVSSVESEGKRKICWKC